MYKHPFRAPRIAYIEKDEVRHLTAKMYGEINLAMDKTFGKKNLIIEDVYPGAGAYSSEL